MLDVAPELLGAMLSIKRGGRTERFMITEVEAYDGEQDKACHASRGRTPKTEGLYRAGGVFYVYLIYGMYDMLNIVTGEKDYPAGVLIRGVEGITGPGRLTRDLGIDRRIHGEPVSVKTGVWIERSSMRVPGERVQTAPRVGVDYAGEWAQKPYRFILRS